jgi:hypothetical protein
MRRSKDEALKIFKKLKSVQNEYPDELTPSTNDLYRLEFIPLNRYKYIIAKNPKLQFGTWFNFTYVAKSSVQS